MSFDPLGLRAAAVPQRRALAIPHAGSEAWVWLYEDQQERLLAAINLTAAAVSFRLPVDLSSQATLVRSTDPERTAGDVRLDRFILLSGEAVLLRLEAPPETT
jgi:hypothetical protein